MKVEGIVPGLFGAAVEQLVPAAGLIVVVAMVLMGCSTDTGTADAPGTTLEPLSANTEDVHEDGGPSWDWDFTHFTHPPVDFQQLMAPESICPYYPPIQPFFNYLVTSHTEGPKKWYLATCSESPVKIYLPVKARLDERGIRITRDEVTGGSEGTPALYDGQEVLSDVQAYFEASADVTVFFMHLTLLKDLETRLNNSDHGFIVLEAGTHIGYLKSADAYGMEYDVVDFGVSDKRSDAGLTRSGDHWWNRRANPLDYFVEDVRTSILTAYEPVYARYMAEGTHPFTNVEDSRTNLNEKGEIWGTWFKGDLPNGFDGASWASDWSVIHVTNVDHVEHATFWKSLEEHPGLSGLWVEADRGNLVGQPLYDRRPNGKSWYYLLSGNASSGVAKIEPYFYQDVSSVWYLKFEIEPRTDGPYHDILRIEAFSSLELAESNGFSDAAVSFRRTPCRETACD